MVHRSRFYLALPPLSSKRRIIKGAIYCEILFENYLNTNIKFDLILGVNSALLKVINWAEKHVKICESCIGSNSLSVRPRISVSCSSIKSSVFLSPLSLMK